MTISPHTESMFRVELADLTAGDMPAKHFMARWGWYLNGETLPPPSPDRPAPEPAPDGYRPWPSATRFHSWVPIQAKNDLKTAKRVAEVVILPDAVAAELGGEWPRAAAQAVATAEKAGTLVRQVVTAAVLEDGRLQANYGVRLADAYAWWCRRGDVATFSHAWRRADGKRWRVAAVEFKKLCKGVEP